MHRQLNVITHRGKRITPKGHAFFGAMLFSKWLDGIGDAYPFRWSPKNPHYAAHPKRK